MYGNNPTRTTYEVEARVSVRFTSTSITKAYKEFEALMARLFEENYEIGYEGTSVKEVEPKPPNLLSPTDIVVDGVFET